MLPPIYLHPEPLHILNDFHDIIRRRWKTRDQPNTFESLALWEREARRRFGPNKLLWRWRCHHCNTSMSASDYLACGAPQSQIGFACIGRFTPFAGCNHDGKNSVPANPVTVHFGGNRVRMLAFAEA